MSGAAPVPTTKGCRESMLFAEDYECACGRVHHPNQAKIVIEAGAIQSLPGMVAELTEGVPLILFDSMTRQLLGQKSDAAFAEQGLQVRNLVLGSPQEPFEPNEAAVEQVRAAMNEHQASLLAGVGSGAINDLGKYVAHELGVPYISVATAPSMDGYMAPISALLIDGVKVTYDTKAPDGVVADLDVLAGAPLPLVSAGFADVVGKLTSLRDWEMAHVLFDEYWCKEVSDHVEGIASSLYDAADSLANRSHESVALLMQGLIEAGISVFYVGNSRPTSGSEHLVSHYVEMRSFNEGHRPPAHGHVVGFGMLVIAELVQKMLELSVDDVRASSFTPSDLHEVLAELRFGEVPDNFGKSKFDRSVRDARLAQIAARWEQIKEVLKKVPTPEAICSGLKQMSAPTTLSELGIDPAVAVQVVKNARYMRERYTNLDLAADLGVLEREAEGIVRKYA